MSRRDPAPPHRRIGLILVVVVGGSLGAACRLLISDGLAGAAGTWPLATLVVNLAGAFGLGVLLETLVATGPEGPKRRVLRLGMGTGFFGGFTTYSGFALDTVDLLGPGDLGPAVGYLALSLAGGLLSAFLGVLAGAWWGRRHNRDPLRGDG